MGNEVAWFEIDRLDKEGYFGDMIDYDGEPTEDFHIREAMEKFAIQIDEGQIDWIDFETFEALAIEDATRYSAGHRQQEEI